MHCLWLQRAVLWQVSVNMWTINRAKPSKANVYGHFLAWKVCLNLHWHTIVKLFNGLIIYSDGDLCVGIKGKLNIVAAVALPSFLSRQLHVFVTSAMCIIQLRYCFFTISDVQYNEKGRYYREILPYKSQSVFADVDETAEGLDRLMRRGGIVWKL